MRRGVRLGLAVGLGAGVVGAVVRVLTSPWPSVRVIRAVFERGAHQTVVEMEKYAPSVALREVRGVPVAAIPASAALPDGAHPVSFDLIAPVDSSEPRPVVVWIHGGAWISGGRRNVVPYLRLLAAEGFATAALDYTIAPEAEFPAALAQLNASLAELVTRADELGVDPTRIVLAGDSAGAQLASQLAVITVDPGGAEQLGIRPALPAGSLVGVVLHCGVYDLNALSDLSGILGWGFKSALWAYTGTKNWSESAAARSMSTIDTITAAFPPAFVSGGNGDGLTRSQSVPFAARLGELGVAVDDLFWPDGHEPELPHEYQFHLDFPDAHTALHRSLAFLHRVADPVNSPQPGATGPTGDPSVKSSSHEIS